MNQTENISNILSIASSLIAIVTFIYQVVKRYSKRKDSQKQTINVANSAVTNSFNSATIDKSVKHEQKILIDRSIKNEQNINIQQNHSTQQAGDDNGILYMVITLLFIPALFKLMKNYQALIVIILTLSALLVWLYNRYKFKKTPSTWETKESVVHYFICCLTAVIPAFSYFTSWAPLPFAKCYELVFNSKTGWLTRMIEYIEPVLYYLSVMFGFILIAMMIINNIKCSRNFFKTKDYSVLKRNNKRRIACLCICLVAVSGGLYWIGYGAFRLTQLMQPVVNQLLNG